jgi:uncharacterized protein YkwD
MKRLLIILFAVWLIPIGTEAQEVEKTTKSDIYQMINDYRADHDLPLLKVNDRLESSASVYAFKLNLQEGKVKHSKAWLKRQKDPCGEIIGESFRPLDRWEKSYTHNKILLAKGWTEFGVGMSGGTSVVRFIKRE